ncbi:MAG TPA: DoxX family protein [Chloroflexota bacterium]|nr:DoxX family protein [Chloroflexota bacterium]HUM67284.1 DoxX family protein [Chloroflexota bacterium]
MINTTESTTKLNRESGGFTRYLAAIRHTGHDKILGSVRIALGILFLMTGLMKLFVPELRAAFSGQLTAADIPFHSLNMWLVPMMETAVGLLLLYGLFSRIGALVVIGLMFVAAYVHLVVSDPALFPLQPTEPIIPILAIGAAVYVLWRGGGAWSADLKWSDKEPI